MAEMVLDCPHCRAERVGFDCAGEFGRLDPNTGRLTWSVLCVCRQCREGVVAKLDQRRGNAAPCAFSGDPRESGIYRLIGIHPQPQPTEAPKHVPGEIASNYEEAADNLHRGNFTSAGMMFRRVLECATEEIDPSLKKTKLWKRIDMLADDHRLTPAMKDLANIIRHRGNQANHDEFDETLAKQLYGFVKLFLTYVFTLPERVRRAQVEYDAK